MSGSVAVGQKYLVYKSLMYPVHSIEAVRDMQNAIVDGMWLATVQDLHTNVPFKVVVTQDMLTTTGFTLQERTAPPTPS